MAISFPKDPLSWNDWAANVDSLQLSSRDKQQVKTAIGYLSDVLGQNFLRKIQSSRQTMTHQFWGLLVNFAPWTRLELAALARDLKSLENSEHLDALLKSFREEKEYPHAELVVRSAARLAREGLLVTFEPTLPISNRQKQPDVRVSVPSTQETAFLEITMQKTSRKEQEHLDTQWRVTEKLFQVGSGVQWSGRVRKALSGPHLKELLARIETAAIKAAKPDGFQEIEEGGSYEFLFCSNEADLRAWCDHRRLKAWEFKGPHAEIDHIERVRSKIAEKQNQLPKNHPGSILISDSDLFFRISDPRTIICQVEEEVCKYPHLAIVVLQAQSVSDSSTEIVNVRQHRYSSRSHERGSEQFILLTNRFSSKPLSEDLTSRFWRAFC